MRTCAAADSGATSGIGLAIAKTIASSFMRASASGGTTAAQAIAGVVDERELRDDYIIPSVFNREVAPAVAAAVAEQARAAGTARAGQEVGFAHADVITPGTAPGGAAGVQVGEGRV